MGSVDLATLPWSVGQLRIGEQQVVALLAKGLDNDEIAERLHFTPETVANKIKCIRDKWKIPDKPKSSVRAKIVLYFLLTEGHLAGLDWDVPEDPRANDTPSREVPAWLR